MAASKAERNGCRMTTRFAAMFVDLDQDSRLDAPGQADETSTLQGVPALAAPVVLELHDEGAGGRSPVDQVPDARGQGLRADHRLAAGQRPALHVDDDQRLDRLGHRAATRIATRTSSSNGPGPSASRRPASNAGSVGSESGERAERTLPTMPANV